MKILILEDDERRIKKFKENLRGHQIFITHQPKAANQLLKEDEFDLILLDHDLMDEHYEEDCKSNETTGLCTGEFLGKNLHLSPKATVIIHSLNPAGSERIRQACEKRNPIKIPFPYFFDRVKLNAGVVE